MVFVTSVYVLLSSIKSNFLFFDYHGNSLYIYDPKYHFHWIVQLFYLKPRYTVIWHFCISIWTLAFVFGLIIPMRSNLNSISYPRFIPRVLKCRNCNGKDDEMQNKLVDITSPKSGIHYQRWQRDFLGMENIGNRKGTIIKCQLY